MYKIRAPAGNLQILHRRPLFFDEKTVPVRKTPRAEALCFCQELKEKSGTS